MVSSMLCDLINTKHNTASERSLPRAQRRGAVIILGMLALARRHVAADRLDVLIRIGLGKLGQVAMLKAMIHTNPNVFM